MQVPFQIRFHNMAASEAIETRVRERVARLERFSDGIISCRVTVEAPHKQPHRSTRRDHRGHQRPRQARSSIKREFRHHELRDDAYQVIGVAFDAAERQLEEHARMQRRAVKTHDGPIYARVVPPVPRAELRLHRDARAASTSTSTASWSKDDAFDDLEVGSEVMYSLADDEGPMGPQASRVRVLRGRHSVR